MTDLFSPARFGAIELANRVVMSSLTRNRAGAGNVPTPLVAEYYRQRASAGLILTEATPICAEGHGYPRTPGIHTPEQVAGKIVELCLPSFTESGKVYAYPVKKLLTFRAPD